jgi:hypothetical protein
MLLLFVPGADEGVDPLVSHNYSQGEVRYIGWHCVATDDSFLCVLSETPPSSLLSQFIANI